MRNAFLKKYYKWVFVIIILAVAYLSFLLIKPFISAILASLLLSYIFFPVFKKIYARIRNKNIASFITCTLILLLILIPLIFTANILIKEANTFYTKIITNDFPPAISNFLETTETNNYIKQGLDSTFQYVISETSSFIVSLPLKILNFFIMLFIIFYLFKDGPELFQRFRNIIPLKEEYKETIIKELKDVTFAIIFGVIITSLVQGAIGGLGFFIFGLNSPLIWGIIMAILAMFPFVGPAFIWVPTGIIQIAYGNLFSGIGILAYGIAVISTIDNIIKPKIISSKAKIHPVIILVGLVGGLKMFGFIGIIAGPLILSFLLVILRVYRSTRQETKRKRY